MGLGSGPGDDIDAWCGKCTMVLNHRIIAVVSGRVRKVECLTCHAIHAYKASPTEKVTAKTPRTAASSTGRAARGPVAKAAKAENEWKVFLSELPDDCSPRPYKPSDNYIANEYIDHLTFGIGRVLEITGAERMLVIFKDGRKTLLCNRSSSPS
jgi:hypothetical protein